MYEVYQEIFVITEILVPTYYYVQMISTLSIHLKSIKMQCGGPKSKMTPRFWPPGGVQTPYNLLPFEYEECHACEEVTLSDKGKGFLQI